MNPRVWLSQLALGFAVLPVAFYGETRNGSVISSLNQTLIILESHYQVLQTYQVLPDAQITLNGLPVRLGAIKPGDSVTLTLAAGTATAVEKVDAMSGKINEPQPAPVPRAPILDWAGGDPLATIYR